MSLTDVTKPTDVSLNTDLYELTMAQGFWENDLMDAEACFTVFFRDAPFDGGYAVACGTGQIDRISLRLNTGIYGLLGANGAGKTTLMRMVCGILKPTSGTITFDGIDVSEERYRSMLGYLPQDFGYYPEFTGEDFLLYMAALKGMRKPQARRKTVELLKLVSLHDVAKKKIKTYSGGMKQRLGIAQALLNQPKLLVLDEPTAGLDPKERVRFRDLIKDLGKDSIVLLSTHIVSDIEHIADDILMMKSGQLIYQGKWTDKSGNLEEFYLKQFEEIE